MNRISIDNPTLQNFLNAIAAGEPIEPFADWLEEQQDPRCEAVRMAIRFGCTNTQLVTVWELGEIVYPMNPKMFVKPQKVYR